MFFHFYKKKKKKKKGNKFTASSYKGLSKVQMSQIANSVISKSRLFVYTETI